RRWLVAARRRCLLLPGRGRPDRAALHAGAAFLPANDGSRPAGPAGQPAPAVDPFPGAPGRSHAVLQPRRGGTRTHAVQGAVAMSYVRWIGLIACSVAGLGYLRSEEHTSELQSRENIV